MQFKVVSFSAMLLLTFICTFLPQGYKIHTLPAVGVMIFTSQFSKNEALTGILNTVFVSIEIIHCLIINSMAETIRK